MYLEAAAVGDDAEAPLLSFSQVPVYLEHWKGREEKMMAMLSHRYHKPY